MIHDQIKDNIARQLIAAQDKLHTDIDAALMALVQDGAGSNEIRIVHYVAQGQTAITLKGNETHLFNHPKLVQMPIGTVIQS